MHTLLCNVDNYVDCLCVTYKCTCDRYIGVRVWWTYVSLCGGHMCVVEKQLVWSKVLKTNFFIMPVFIDWVPFIGHDQLQVKLLYTTTIYKSQKYHKYDLQCNNANVWGYVYILEQTTKPGKPPICSTHTSLLKIQNQQKSLVILHKKSPQHFVTEFDNQPIKSSQIH